MRESLARPASSHRGLSPPPPHTLQQRRYTPQPLQHTYPPRHGYPGPHLFTHDTHYHQQSMELYLIDHSYSTNDCHTPTPLTNVSLLTHNHTPGHLFHLSFLAPPTLYPLINAHDGNCAVLTSHAFFLSCSAEM